MKFPDYPQSGKPVADTVKQIIDFLRSARVVGISGGRVKTTPNGTTLELDRVVAEAAASSTTSCAFGTIETWTTGEGETLETHYGLSGIIHCGPLNWDIYRMEIDCDTDGTFLMSYAIDVIANRDDDDEILLPNLETGTQPTAFVMTAWVDETTNYPDNEEPEIPDGAGNITTPLGRVTITDGVPLLVRTGCGNITLGHCGGTLSYSRG